MPMLRALVRASIICAALGAQAPVLRLAPALKAPFTFAAYGDTRFTDPANHEAANPVARQLLVKAMAGLHPAFISIGGDIPYNGADADDWKVFDEETAPWREQKIPLYPVLGNHELQGREGKALANFFRRFPALGISRFYSVAADNALLLNLDSSQDELAGPQGAWLKGQLEGLAPDVEFVFLVLHHPPVTNSTSAAFSGHPARPMEQALARMLEERQGRTRARFVVLAGHVHNYERHEHGGVTYYVTGGGGARPYPVPRGAGNPAQDSRVNFHYLEVRVERGAATITMHRVGLETGTPVWTSEDTVKLTVPKAP